MMRRFVLLMVLIISLFSFNIVEAAPVGGTCLCSDGEWYLNNCNNCYLPQCVGLDVCSCELGNPDWVLGICLDSACTIDTTPEDGIIFGQSFFGDGFSRCCGDDNSEYFINYAGTSNDACCNEADDCSVGQGNCFDSGTLYTTNYYCKAGTTRYCPTTSVHNDYELNDIEEGGFCCVDVDSSESYNWDWVSCFCSSYQSVCINADGGCSGTWVNSYENPFGYDICCTGSVTAAYERVGGGYWTGTEWYCNTLDLGDPNNCFVDEARILV